MGLVYDHLIINFGEYRMNPVQRLWGSAEVEVRETKEPVQLIIRKERLGYGLRQLNGYILVDGKEKQVGYIKYTKVGPNLAEDGIFGSANGAYMGSNGYYGRWPDVQKFVPFIYVDRIETRHFSTTYKKVGTKLMQAVIEIALKRKFGSQGRVRLNAQHDSHVFYNKQGFLAQSTLQIFDYERGDPLLMPKQVDEEIEALKKRGPDGKDFGSVEMFLPQSQIEEWSKIIERSRIRHPKITP